MAESLTVGDVMAVLEYDIDCTFDDASLSIYNEPVKLLISRDASLSVVSQSILTPLLDAPTMALFKVILSALIVELVLPVFKILSEAATRETVSAVICASAVSNAILFELPPAVIETVSESVFARAVIGADKVTAPSVVAMVTSPEVAVIPATLSTVPIARALESLIETLPAVSVVIATVPKALEALDKVTAPPADTAKLVAVMAPLAALTAPVDFTCTVLIAGAIAALTVTAP